MIDGGAGWNFWDAVILGGLAGSVAALVVMILKALT